MKLPNEFNIPFIGLKIGNHRFDYKIDKAFFDFFEYKDFNNLNIDVDLVLEKKSTLLELHFDIKGYVNVNCDLTNEPYNQYVSGEFDLVVKFGSEFNDKDEHILIIPHGEYQINVAQYIYETIVLSVPLKRVHPGVKDGTLKSDILDKLKEFDLKKSITEEKTVTDPRWDTLKQLLTDK